MNKSQSPLGSQRSVISTFNQSTFLPTEPDKPFLLATDIDGTLLGDPAGEASFKAFVRKHSDSFYLAVITGRSLVSVQELITTKQLPCPHFICSAVGTKLLDCGDPRNNIGEKYAARVPKDWDLETIYRLGEGNGIWRQEFPEGQPRFQAGFYWDGQPDTLAAFRGRLTEQPGCRILPSSNRFIDVFPSFVGKGEAAIFLQQELGLDASRVVIAGDSGNDTEMFETGFKGVVPINALEELKQIACQPWHYQSPFPAARGVMDGLSHFGLVKAL